MSSLIYSITNTFFKEKPLYPFPTDSSLPKKILVTYTETLPHIKELLSGTPNDVFFPQELLSGTPNDVFFPQELLSGTPNEDITTYVF